MLKLYKNSTKDTESAVDPSPMKDDEEVVHSDDDSAATVSDTELTDHIDEIEPRFVDTAEIRKRFMKHRKKKKAGLVKESDVEMPEIDQAELDRRLVIYFKQKWRREAAEKSRAVPKFKASQVDAPPVLKKQKGKYPMDETTNENGAQIPFEPKWNLSTSESAFRQADVAWKLAEGSVLPADRLSLLEMAHDTRASQSVQHAVMSLNHTFHMAEQYLRLSKVNDENVREIRRLKDIIIKEEKKRTALEAELAALKETREEEMILAKAAAIKEYRKSPEFKAWFFEHCLKFYIAGWEMALEAVLKVYPDLDYTKILPDVEFSEAEKAGDGNSGATPVLKESNLPHLN